GRAGTKRNGRGPGSVKRHDAASDVRLIVVVKRLFELQAKSKRVPPMDLGELWRKVPLRIPVQDGALPLAAGHERVTQRKARSHWRAFAVGNQRIVRRRPAFLGYVEALVDR